jgi:hypothetical protein
MPVISALGRLREDNHEFGDSLGYLGKTLIQKKKSKKNKQKIKFNLE